MKQPLQSQQTASDLWIKIQAVLSDQRPFLLLLTILQYPHTFSYDRSLLMVHTLSGIFPGTYFLQRFLPVPAAVPDVPWQFLFSLPHPGY